MPVSETHVLLVHPGSLNGGAWMRGPRVKPELVVLFGNPPNQEIIVPSDLPTDITGLFNLLNYDGTSECTSVKVAFGAPEHVGTSMLLQSVYHGEISFARPVVVDQKYWEPVEGNACGVSTS